MTSQNKGIPQNIDDKLFTVKYKPDSTSHLEPDLDKCKECPTKICTYFCPAHVYDWDTEQHKLIVGYENCIECGACRVGCHFVSIEWRYPRASYGVTFKHS
jgi:ferredoxin like protein